ncbi:cytochrome c oxidase subunit 3 family protein [Planctomycetota bacterium]|nr:cytochrome c oxidase subunit 3 family protein [Planctomycetota bacterium]
MGDHGHGEGHHKDLAHHFDDMDQQVESGKLGMWLFLATEVLLFAGMFCAYAVYRANHPEVFQYASQFLDTTLGAINTVVLLVSSFTVAAAVRYAQLNNKAMVVKLMIVTLLCAAGFLGIKYVEYKHKFEAGLVWGLEYHPNEHAFHAEEHDEDAPAEGEAEEPAATNRVIDGVVLTAGISLPRSVDAEVSSDRAPLSGTLDGQRSLVAPAAWGPGGMATPEPAEAPGGKPIEGVHTEEDLQNVHIFFGIYFLMTGLHGLHVLIGMIAITWVTVRAHRGDFDETYNFPIDLVALYWHIVDLIWIYLFPLLYLI